MFGNGFFLYSTILSFQSSSVSLLQPYYLFWFSLQFSFTLVSGYLCANFIMNKPQSGCEGGNKDFSLNLHSPKDKHPLCPFPVAKAIQSKPNNAPPKRVLLPRRQLFMWHLARESVFIVSNHVYPRRKYTILLNTVI